jgi:hypothetical protein
MYKNRSSIGLTKQILLHSIFYNKRIKDIITINPQR